MSLDLYIISPEPVVKHGTGVFVRENGRNVELKTMEEVRAHFPNSDLLHIHEYEYTDEDYWHGNITHNMCGMAREVPIDGTELTLYDLLWQPDEHGFKLAGDAGYRGDVLIGFIYLREHRNDLIQFNPENGWGNYDLLLAFTLDFLQHLILAGDDYPIRASV